jgi:RNA polymerase sigma-70 factor (ECF subfamily)
VNRVVDNEKLQRLFLEHRDHLYSYIYALVREANTAEDIFQEVGVRVVSKGEAVPAESDFAAWCRGIARNLVLHHWRAQRRNPVIPNSRLLEALDRAYAEAEDTSAASQPGLWALVECLRLLSEPARTVVELRYYQGKSAAAIGQRLQRSGEAIRQLLVRVRRQLAECVRARLALGGNHGS